ncbi:MAG: PLP-dependent aminotransferase family protein [Chloroflexota bacterium]|nr:MAG: PLP-dependent aminotransferase family protein [Chloroflexota bacterium]
MKTLWEQHYAQRTQRIKSSAIRELLKLAERKDVISFAGGLPAAESFPLKQLEQAMQRVIAQSDGAAFQYSTTEGYLPLRDMIARHTSRYGLNITPDNLLITAGSQQGLDLLGRIFINPGDRILVEAPTYLGALQAWNAYGAEYISVPVDQDGMKMDVLEAMLRTGPKFIYVLPNFQNPSGVTLSAARRLKLVELANHYGVPIIEDDPYGQLRYEGKHIPAVAVLDTKGRDDCDTCYRGNVIYLSTFSKVLAPGLRVAWVVAAPEVIEKLVQAKQGADLQTATFNQMLIYQVAREGFLDHHIKSLRTLYRTRRDAMLNAMQEHFPQAVQWTHPEGGLFLWATLPEGIDSAEVLRAAIQERVAFVPGASFHANGQGANTMRLNFSNATPEQIYEGIARLGQVLETQLDQVIATP